MRERNLRAALSGLRSSTKICVMALRKLHNVLISHASVCTRHDCSDSESGKGYTRVALQRTSYRSYVFKPTSKPGRLSRVHTKFESIMAYLAEITEERVLIQFAYSGACNLLAEYIRRRFPGREVYMYHGDIPNRAAHMEKFQSGASNAILIATRGACEKAVDVHATTTRMVYNPSLGYSTPIRFAVRQIFGDVALSFSEQQQAEGRTKRILAQGWDSDPDKVQEWICAESIGQTPDTFPTIEMFMRKVVELKLSLIHISEPTRPY